jgi:hypothetical protein
MHRACPDNQGRQSGGNQRAVVHCLSIAREEPPIPTKGSHGDDGSKIRLGSHHLTTLNVTYQDDQRAVDCVQ